MFEDTKLDNNWKLNQNEAPISEAMDKYARDGALAFHPGAIAEDLQQAASGIDHDPLRPFPDRGEAQDVQVEVLCLFKLFGCPAFQGNMVDPGDHLSASPPDDTKIVTWIRHEWKAGRRCVSQYFRNANIAHWLDK